MKRVVVIIVALTALLAGATLHSDEPPFPKEAVLVAGVTPDARIVVFTVNNGSRSWSSITKLTVPPGRYDLRAFCATADLPLSKAIQGNKTIAVEAGHVYEIVGTLSENKRRCYLALSSGS